MTEPVSFKARVQRYNRIQIPVKVRWAYRLEPSEVFRVDLRIGYHCEEFHGRMSKDGRLTIPLRIAEQWLHPGDPLYTALAGHMAKVTLYPIHSAEEE